MIVPGGPGPRPRATRMTMLTISEAARAWGVHRDTVRHWLRDGKIEGTRGNDGVWRVAEGQQPPPGVELRRPRVERPGAIMGPSEDNIGSDDPGPATDGVGALHQRLTVAERDLAVTRRELELVREVLEAERERHREALSDARAERDQMAELLRLTLDRPPWWVRWVRAVRTAGQ